MPAYRVQIKGRARSKIRNRSPILQMVIFDVIENEFRLLPDPTNLDEGMCCHPRLTLPGVRSDSRLRWRRCVTETSRALLDAGLVPDPAVEDACDYVLIYRVPRVQSTLEWAERFQTYVLEDFLHNSEVAHHYIRAETSTLEPEPLIDPLESSEDRGEPG